MARTARSIMLSGWVSTSRGGFEKSCVYGVVLGGRVAVVTLSPYRRAAPAWSGWFASLVVTSACTSSRTRTPTAKWTDPGSPGRASGAPTRRDTPPPARHSPTRSAPRLAGQLRSDASSTSPTVSAMMKLISSRTLSGTSSRSASLRRGTMTSFRPARWAARTFCLTPPMGSTLP